MNEILRVDNDTMTISARELHEALDIKYDFKRWVESNFRNFVEGEDFNSHMDVKVQIEGNRQVQRSYQDYQLSIDMAKHLCLMSQTDKGKECRQYLIDLEKAWNTPAQVMARALKIADATIADLQNEVLCLTSKVEEMQPKISYLDKILENPSTVLVTQIAQDYGMSAKKFNKLLHELRIQHKVNNQWILYADYLNEGYTHSHTHTFERFNGCLDSKMHTEWTQKGRLFLYQELKKNGVLPLIEME